MAEMMPILNERRVYERRDLLGSLSNQHILQTYWFPGHVIQDIIELLNEDMSRKRVTK